MNDARIAPAKSPDIKSPIGVNHRDEWPGIVRNADTDKKRDVDTNKNSDTRSPSSTKQWNTRPSTTPKLD